ncbi:hypothetical protein HD806DRAFT_543408 [Xylariaceae sp. AK1471]|nr:hypothetical protein HD806DRAFT_543408 [Xylariaceae sp. AK1471]
MLFLHLLPFPAAAWAAVVSQAGTPTGELQSQNWAPANYSIVDTEWRGFADFDKDHVFTGTIEDVIHQMRQIKGAHFTPDFMLGPSSHVENRSTNLGGANLESIQCGGNGANPGRIKQGINYLHNLHDDVLCSNGAGPRNCGRISCSWNSGISWCNEKTVPSDTFKCNMFAGYAQEILDNCAIYDENPRVSGANWDEDLAITVLVAKASC